MEEKKRRDDHDNRYPQFLDLKHTPSIRNGDCLIIGKLTKGPVQKSRHEGDCVIMARDAGFEIISSRKIKACSIVLTTKLEGRTSYKVKGHRRKQTATGNHFLSNLNDIDNARACFYLRYKDFKGHYTLEIQLVDPRTGASVLECFPFRVLSYDKYKARKLAAKSRICEISPPTMSAKEPFNPQQLHEHYQHGPQGNDPLETNRAAPPTSQSSSAYRSKDAGRSLYQLYFWLLYITDVHKSQNPLLPHDEFLHTLSILEELYADTLAADESDTFTITLIEERLQEIQDTFHVWSDNSTFCSEGPPPMAPQSCFSFFNPPNPDNCAAGPDDYVFPIKHK